MGTVQDVYLPFHLAGIINYSRLTIIPILYAMFLSRAVKTTSKHTFLRYLVIYIIWLLLETFVRLSRGALIANVISLGIVFIMVGSVKVKDMIRFALPIAIVAVMLFPLVSSLRSITRDNKITTQDIKTASQGKTDLEETIRGSYLRMFSTLTFYNKIYDVVSENQPFDFSRAPLIVIMGGSHYFVTSEIDRRGLDEGHNSGSTGIIDALLFGGYGFCYIVFFFSVLAILWLDSEKFVSRPFVRYVLFSVFIWFIKYRSVSYFLDPEVVEQLLVSGILLVYFLHYYRTAPRQIINFERIPV